jgi:hypothetical protein
VIHEQGRIKMLRIEVDAHFRGGEPVKPWVARIDGVDPQYGLARHFIDPLNDWANAHRAWSGNLYGVVANFPLREGNLYEVSRTRGKPSKRHVVREFLAPADGKLNTLEPLEALARVEGHREDVRILRLADDKTTQVTELDGPGSGTTLGWVVIDKMRHYRLRHGRLYEVREDGSKRFAVGDHRIDWLTPQGALQWLVDHA